MNDSRFHVIEGGLSQSQRSVCMEEMITLADGSTICGRSLCLEKAWVTNTRLMGVLVMGLTFRCGGPDAPLLHEWFYFDAVYFGFDRFEYCFDESTRAILEIENSFIGGLGGEKRSITRREAAWILARYLRKSEKVDAEPQRYNEFFRFLAEEAEELSFEEQEALWHRVCKKADTDFERVNYYLIRLCDKDYDGIRYVTKDLRLFTETIEEAGEEELPGRELDHGAWETTARELASTVPPTTLYQSDLETELDGAITARLIAGDDEGDFWLYIVWVRLQDGYVAESQICSGMKISEREAMMNSMHDEYVLCLDFDGEPWEIDRWSSRYLERAMIMEEEGGRLFMIYYPDNSHVDQKHYRIYNDLIGNVYVTGSSQVLVFSNSIRTQELLEADLQTTSVGARMTPFATYQFGVPVMRVFIESGMTDFKEFLELIGAER